MTDRTAPDDYRIDIELPGTAYFRDGRENVAIEDTGSKEQLARILEPRTSDRFVIGLVWNLIEHVQARDKILASLGYTRGD